MSALEFQEWPKIARLNRNITVTEKIDGTNAAVVIVPTHRLAHVTDRAFGQYDRTHLTNLADLTHEVARVLVPAEGGGYDEFSVFAQSRTRFITPEADNYGFAAWVKRHAQGLVEALGEGTHFGEWWGAGIQRKYGLTGSDKRFSLFNTNRWDPADIRAEVFHRGITGLGVVPVLYEGPFSQAAIQDCMARLYGGGSRAASGFMRPEGIVIWHEAARTSFKVTLEGDEAPKGAAAHAKDEERAA